MYTFEQIKEKVKDLSRTQRRVPIVAIAQAADKIALETTKLLNEQGLGRAILVGDERRIHEIAHRIDLNLEPNLIINVPDTAKAALRAVKACVMDEADVLCKGHLHTNTYLRAILNKEAGMRTGQTLCSITAVQNPQLGRLFLSSDCAMIVNPNLKDKVSIINNSTILSNALGSQNPKIALLSAVEELNENMPDGYESAVITQMNRRGQIKGCVVDGPLSLDLAISPYSARNKGINSPVAGHADVLVMPNLQSGNIFWKSMTYLAGSQTGAVVMGASKPVVLTSRSDDAQSKLNSITIALLLADYMKKHKN